MQDMPYYIHFLFPRSFQRIQGPV